MESRRQRPAPRATRSVKHKAVGNGPVAALSLPNIAQLIDYGEITVGVLRPSGLCRHGRR